MDLVVVIMAGGAGTRFWPASLRARPKQLLPLVGERTMLQQAYDRVQGLVPDARIFVVTSEALAPAVVSQLPSLPLDNVLAEPERKDTAAAVAWAALVVQQRCGDVVIATLTADHVVAPTEAFQADLRAAVVEAEGGALVTFGIPPTYAATGYGYVRLAPGGRVVKTFVEKPDAARARQLVDAGALWNSGMFVWRASAILRALEEHLPAHLALLRPAVEGGALLRDNWGKLQSISIDRGVMERAKDVRCVKATFSWSDVGSFPALGAHLEQDASENAHRGRVAVLDAHRNVVWSEDPAELVALVGVEDLIVVRAGKRTLVAPRARAEDIKRLVERLPPEDT
jgi:mannose-1-phosphate guanylyltransferase